MPLKTLSRWNAAPAVAISIALSGAPCHAAGGYVSPEALDAPVASLSGALTAFATQTELNALAGYRRAARRDLVRADIRDFVIGDHGAWEAQAFAGSVTPATALLCLPRYGYLRIAVPLQNTAAKAAAITDTLHAPKDDIPSLLKTLAKSYTVDPTMKVIAADYDSWIRDEAQGKPCADAVVNADPFKTRGAVGREMGVVAVVTAAKAAFDLVWTVVKPAVTGILQNVDAERRNAAVKDYFSDGANVAALKSDLSHVERFLAEEFGVAQLQTAGVAVVSIRALDAFDGPPLKAALSIMNGAECREQFSKLAKDRTDPDAVACLNKVYGALDPALKTALDAADAFDVVMDRQIPRSPLSQQVDTVAAIARGGQPDDSRLATLWSTMLRYTTLFQEVEAVGSSGNLKKIGGALDALKQALQ